MIRKYFYPIWIFINNKIIKLLLNDDLNDADIIFWGQRGNDYAAHRRRVKKLVEIKGSTILIAGCGAGKDLLTWLEYEPKLIYAVDLFNYAEAWRAIQNYVLVNNIKTKLIFIQSNLEDMSFLESESIDIVSSDAVFEHLNNLNVVLAEFRRVIRKDGYLYSTFGPLWHAWGGDHVSGYDNILDGYNHLLLNNNDYDKYIAKLASRNVKSDIDFTWIENNLFSKLKVIDYCKSLEMHDFKKEYMGLIIDPRSIRCLINKDLAKKLFKLNGVTKFDLIFSGMSIIYRK